jgi:endonuclease YncB( thermonuclease family)
MRWRRRLRSFTALLLLSALALIVWSRMPATVATLPPAHVIDGDSLHVRRDGATLTIRLTGIDAVEYRQPCQDANGPWPCGREARDALEKLVGTGPLHCELGAKDAYRRTLAACRTRPFPDGVDLGAEMVRQGWAVSIDDSYAVEQAEAEAKRRGIWRGGFTPPGEWRADHARPSAA